MRTTAKLDDDVAAAVERFRRERRLSRSEALNQLVVRARSMPCRPIPDALIVAALTTAGAAPLATFDEDQRRYGVATREP